MKTSKQRPCVPSGPEQDLGIVWLFACLCGDGWLVGALLVAPAGLVFGVRERSSRLGADNVQECDLKGEALLCVVLDETVDETG